MGVDIDSNIGTKDRTKFDYILGVDDGAELGSNLGTKDRTKFDPYLSMRMAKFLKRSGISMKS